MSLIDHMNIKNNLFFNELKHIMLKYKILKNPNKQNILIIKIKIQNRIQINKSSLIPSPSLNRN